MPWRTTPFVNSQKSVPGSCPLHLVGEQARGFLAALGHLPVAFSAMHGK
jgi:hypothetical protein